MHLPRFTLRSLLASCGLLAGILGDATLAADTPPLAIRGGTVYTQAGPAITDGVVLIENGRIKVVGPAADVTIPTGTKVKIGRAHA